METLAGRYRLLEPLGSGGMSVVWRGYDSVLGRQVAVKVLAARFASDAEFRSRIRREAQAVARLSDPHITNVYDYGEARDGTPFVVMELIQGTSLADRLDQGPLSWESAVRIGAAVAGALATAHANGIVHRDIKPANVMLTSTGVKVVDFGISAVAGERGGPVLGTPGYLAPEQSAGAPATPATDVYALGLLLSRALPPGAAVPADLAELIRGCLAPEPGRRPSSALVATRLTAILTAPRPAASATRVLGPVPVGRHGTRVMPPPPPVPPGPRRPRRWPVLLGSAAVVLVACLAGASLVHRRQDGSVSAGPTPTRPAAVGTTRATTAASPQPSPTTACLVDYQVTDYGIGFEARLTVTNSGGADISRWTLEFDLPDEQKLAVGWGGVWKQDGTRITVSDLLLNGSVQPGKSVDLGFVGTSRGNTDKPRQFSLNGVACGQSDG